MKVTIKVERTDGQFTIAQTEVPDNPGVSRVAIADKIRNGFLDAYQRALDLED